MPLVRRDHINLGISNISFMVVHILQPLGWGGLIYLLYRRTDELWISSLVPLPQNAFSFQAPDWIIYNLPDGLWLYACMNFQLLNWNFVISSQNWVWIMALPIIAILSEYLQFLGVLNGTADVLDVLIYIITTLIILVLNQYVWGKQY